LLVEAAFSKKELKARALEVARIENEIMKHLIRNEHELEIINEKTYLRLSAHLVEISKMISGWISYIVKMTAV
jgi:predicted small metal-binding protein